MSTYLSRLNPAERRFVIVVGLVFFVVINIFFIWPRFSDWGTLRGRLANSRDKHAKYESTIQQRSKIEAEMKKLASEGSYVPPEDQSLQFSRIIVDQAAKSGVHYQGGSRSFTSTNTFFIEQGQTISIVASETNLVDFLYSLGSGNSLIRAREISIRPDPPRQNLNASITLVASYQKSAKAPAKPTTAAGAKTPAASPAPGTRTTSPQAVPLPKPAPKSATPNKK